ncbi:hypothetical protein SDRG_02792 [Saprolegnia diclina VS20]|uniref:Uncharacterized protein n=1 Tax=Saprolegnia diclina (strain VS20) TaxID=1156394 RepID=T0SBK3_SAPDV|nr:hypothetical protein SDRG_02792 [Saprolegnia diclina VS20]EQC40142.1 hypothetical protein SDRG_02792 [Saprolegnia diclina VS20]|eukprot:XP_008606616.1 hypothetical protein SDRG_02792 [Saprolegnia diclina VS20]
METPLHRVDNLIAVATRRLHPSALQSLRIEEILAQRTLFPPLEQKDIAGSGFEAHATYLETLDEYVFGQNDKWDAMRYMAVRELMRECALAKRSAMHAACVARALEWIESTGNEHDEMLRAPSLSKLETIKLHRGATPADVRPRVSFADAPVPEQLLRYEQRDLRTSHIHRIAELKEKGISLPQPPPVVATEPPKSNQTELLELERQRAGYKFHTPETVAEIALNEVWRQRRDEDAQAKVQANEVQSVLFQWTMTRSRDEAELLRKQESSRMMTHRQSTPVLPSSRPSTSSALSNQDDMDLLRPTPTKSLMGTAPVVIKKAASANTGMRFRNPLPANFKRISHRDTLSVHAPTSMGRSYSMGDVRPMLPEADAPPPAAYYPASYMLSVPAEAAKTPPLQRVKRKKNKMDVRGLVPTQPVPLDSEFRVFHAATTARQCPSVRTEGKKGHGMSALRREELDEVDAIRAAFERHHMTFNAHVFERALLTPEDRPGLECVKRLPTAGSKLPENPLGSLRHSLHKSKEGKTTKKKKKTKKRKPKGKKAKAAA